MLHHASLLEVGDIGEGLVHQCEELVHHLVVVEEFVQVDEGAKALQLGIHDCLRWLL